MAAAAKGQRFRFEKTGCKPRTFVLMDVAAGDMTQAEVIQHAAKSSKGDVVFLRNTKTKKIAAVMVDWLDGRSQQQTGRWGPIA